MDLPIVASSDELRQCQDVLADGTAEIEFRRFLQTVREIQSYWKETLIEAQRLQRELDMLQQKFEECMQERSNFETKLFHARRLLEAESRAKRQLEEKLSTACDLLNTDREMSMEKRNTIASITGLARKRRPKSSPCRIEEDCNEINSTCSFLSDFSMTLFEDELLDVTKPFKKRRPSNPSDEFPYIRRTSSIQRSIGSTNKISAHLDANLSIKNERSFKSMPSHETTLNLSFCNDLENVVAIDKLSENDFDNEQQSQNSVIKLQMSSTNRENEKKSPKLLLSMERINEHLKLFNNFQKRPHDFITRKVLLIASCAHCLKKLRFGVSVLKCRTCRIHLHQNCEIHFTKVCTPKRNNKVSGKQEHLSDYVSTGSPKIPSLIVQCITEVERRGLSELGIYRVSGSDKEIKSLKERILQGKTTEMTLSTVDIHVICGCIKDFLRGLKEPIIPTNLWTTFSNSVQTIDDIEIEKKLMDAINLLPQINRMTLAYLILHLQRVANCTVNQMPIENLARIFGPTVIGYSGADSDYQIYAETLIQKDVMGNLLKIQSTYWKNCMDEESIDKVMLNNLSSPSKSEYKNNRAKIVLT